MSAKASPAKTNLTVVPGAEPTAETAPPSGNDTPADQASAAVESALAHFENEYRPTIRRSDVARQRTAQQVREVEGLLSDLDAREALLDRVYEAAKHAIIDQRLDLSGELSLYQNGLVGSSTQEP